MLFQDPNAKQNCTPAVAKRAMQTMINLGMPVSAIGLQQTFNGYGVADIVEVKLDDQPPEPQAFMLQVAGQWVGAAQCFASAYLNHPFENFETRAYYLYLQTMQTLNGRTPTKDEFRLYLATLPAVSGVLGEAISRLEVPA